MIRLFVAIELPDALRRRLAMLCNGVKGARWVDVDNLHLTLRFIGDTGEEHVEDIVHALDGVKAAPFPMSLAGAGHFESRRRVRSLWIGIEPQPRLVALQERIEAALQRAGCAPDGRRFSPHITLARLNMAAPDTVRNWLHANTLFRAEPLAIDRFVLFHSLRGSGGSVYRPLAEFPLVDSESM